MYNYVVLDNTDNSNLLLILNFCFLRLNSSDDDGEPLYIQMVTALVLQLIQCVVHLPNDKDIFDECDKVRVSQHMQASKYNIYTLAEVIFRRTHKFFFWLFLGGSGCFDNQLIWDGYENSTKLPLSLPQKVITILFYTSLKCAMYKYICTVVLLYYLGCI